MQDGLGHPSGAGMVLGGAAGDVLAGQTQRRQSFVTKIYEREFVGGNHVSVGRAE